MKRAALLFGLFATATVTVAETSGYSLEEAHAYRNAWTLENWDEGGPLMRYVFLNMPEFWTHSIISRGNDARKLPLKLRDDVGAFRTTTDAGKKSLSDYVNNAAVNGAIVVHRGEIVFESYPRMRSQDKHLYMSVAKEFAATLIAILEDRGLIDVSRSVDHYLPSLADSGWAGVPIIDVLDMASGIGCLEMEEDAYSNPERCYYQYEASLGWQKATAATNDSPFDFMATLKSHRPAGEAYEYTSPNTFILGWLAESITAQPLADLISTEIWMKMGAEADGLLAAPRRGVPIISGGISSTLRDLARFGLLFTPSGRAGPHSVVSASYLDKIQHGGRPTLLDPDRSGDIHQVDGEPIRHSTYQWSFVMEDGDFFKSGFGGQGLYVSPAKDLVIAFFGTFDEGGENGHDMERVARQLAKSGLFN